MKKILPVIIDDFRTDKLLYGTYKKEILFIFYTMLFFLIVYMPLTAQTKTKINKPTKVRVRSSESKKLKVTWKKVKKADGYQIYEYKKSNKKFKKVADVDGKTRSWKSGNTKKVHTYKVHAYKKSGKRKVYSKFSYTVSARPYKRNAIQVNAGRLRFKEDVLDLSVHQCLTPTLKIKATRYATNSRAQIYDSTIRWFSSDETIARVDKNGAITTQGKEGSCKIYARAHNGNVTWIKVYAEDYATNVKFRNVQAMLDDMQNLIYNYQKEIEQIAAYFEKNKAEHPKENQKMFFSLNDERTKVLGTVTSGSEIYYKEIEEIMLRVLQSFLGDMEINVTNNVVGFKLCGTNSQYVELKYIFYSIVGFEEIQNHFLTAERWTYHYRGFYT